MEGLGKKRARPGSSFPRHESMVGRVSCYRDFTEDKGWAPEGHCNLSGNILGGEVGVEALLEAVKTEWVVSKGRSCGSEGEMEESEDTRDTENVF